MGKMKIKIILPITLVLALSSIGFAQSKIGSHIKDSELAHARSLSQPQTIEQLAKAVAKAWSKGTLGSLDAQRPYVGSVRVVLEQSLGESPLVERKTFRTLAQADRWFKKGERADGPGRNTGTLKQCVKGDCTFEQEGMLHNNLYLQKITYGMTKGKPYIKAIHIISGD
jgi:hypothetical protein